MSTDTISGGDKEFLSEKLFKSGGKFWEFTGALISVFSSNTCQLFLVGDAEVKKGASPSSSEPPLVPEVLPSVCTSAAEGCHTMTPPLYGETLLYPSSTHYQKDFIPLGFYRAIYVSQISLRSHQKFQTH